ncbi:MAG TPA: methyl-accepting chemotaxis protein [Anaerolineaceae bacterium]|nr:methyl-accepting chemotaxis protein [Anaerolineaceae bacterium]
MNKSVFSRLISSFVPLVVVTFSALIIVASIVSTNAQKSNAYQYGTAMAAEYANGFNAELQADQALGRTMAQMMESNSTQNRQEVMNALKNLLDQHPEVVGTYVGYEANAFDGKDASFAGGQGTDATGRFIPYWNRLTGNLTLDPLADVDTSDYYLIPKRTKADSVIEPYLYEGVLMTSFISPIMKPDGTFIGIAGADTSLASWDKRVQQIKSFDTGYAWLVSNTGIFISAPDKSFIGTKTLADLAKEKSNQQLTQLAGQIQAKKSGFVETTDPFTGKNVVMFYAPIDTGGWSLVNVVPVNEMMASANSLRNILIAIGVFTLLLINGIIFVFSRSFAKPIIEVWRAASKIADGDLDVQLNINQQDEIGRMAIDFQRMVAYLSRMANSAQRIARGDLSEKITPQSERDVLGNAFAQMVANVRSSVTRVAENASSLGAASGQLASSAEQAGQATSQIAATIQQVARGTSQQTESVTRTASSVEQMSRAIDGVARGAQEQAQAVARTAEITHELTNAIQQVTSNAEAGAKGSEQAAQVARSGTEIVHATIQGMETIQEKVALSSQIVQDMGVRSERISMIVETIEDIASQTNLLALNAAIEAARAGEHGKGFAVVADEVRKLAEKSAQATKEIGGLVKEIQSTVADAVEAMQAGSTEVERGVGQAKQAGLALSEILGAAETVNRQVGEIATEAKHMSHLSDELVAASDGVSAVVEENTAATEEMSAGAAEVTQSIENIASVSEENSAAVEEVGASAEEMSAQVEEVTASAQALSEMAQALQAIVAQFNLTGEDVQASKNSLPAKPTARYSEPGTPLNGNGHEREVFEEDLRFVKSALKN